MATCFMALIDQPAVPFSMSSIFYGQYGTHGRQTIALHRLLVDTERQLFNEGEAGEYVEGGYVEGELVKGDLDDIPEFQW